MAILGGLGTGKTLTLTYFLHKYHRGKKTYSNFHLSFPHEYIEDPESLLDVNQGNVGLDELWAWMDSRMSGSKKNRVLGHFLLTSRKRGCNIIYTAQHFRQVDCRVRNVTDFLVFPTFDKKRSILSIDMISQFDTSYHRKFSLDARPLFKMYNTNEEIAYYDPAPKETSE